MSFRSPLFVLLALLLGGPALTGCATSSRLGAGAAAWRAKEMSREAAMEMRIRTFAHYATGLSHELNDRPNMAMEEMLRAALTDPSQEPIVVEAVRRALRASQPDKAIALLTKATALPDAPGNLHAWLGLAHAQAGHAEAAIAANRTAIKKMPQSLVGYQNLAQIYLQNSRTNDALRVLDEAASQAVEEPGFLIDLAEFYLHLGRGAGPGEEIGGRVKELLDRAAVLSPSDPVQLLRTAEMYFALGELKKAEPFYLQLVEQRPDLPSFRGKLTEIYLRNGQKEKAAEQVEALARSEPTNPQAYLVLGALAAEQKNYAEAAEHLERALRLDPDLEQVYYELAGLLIGKKPEEALAWLEKARSRFKAGFLMEFYTGLAYSSAKKHTEALNHLTSAEAIARATEPGRLNHFFLFQLGACQERAGHIEEAERYFREALKLAPNDPETLNYLGYMFADRGIQLEEARVMIEKAVALEPENAAFLDSLAWVLFKLNKPEEALAPMLKALGHSEEPDATLYDHLGDIYSALERMDEALEAWEKALEIEPSEAIQEKLDTALSGSRSAP